MAIDITVSDEKGDGIGIREESEGKERASSKVKRRTRLLLQ
jgi:hypothetical protein